MSKAERVAITSRHVSDFETVVEAGREKFIVQTEDLGRKKHEIVTAVYLDGRIVKSVRTDYSSISDARDLEARLHSLMQRQHKQAVKGLREDRDMTPAKYMDELKRLMKKKNFKPALYLITEALESYPEDAFLLSYYGLLVSQVEKRHREGVEICLKALTRLKETVPFGQEFFYPVFYLNLGRAHLASGDKKKAYAAFEEGLNHDSQNHDLRWEIKKLGTRKSPVLPFFSRGNIVNKYLGKLRATIGR